MKDNNIYNNYKIKIANKMFKNILNKLLVKILFI
jgi:hypothetical protein